MNRLRYVRKVTDVFFFAVLPVFALYLVFLDVTHEGKVTDFENAFYRGAEDVLHGRNPYPAVDDPSLAFGTEYVYSPLTAIVSVPFTAVSAYAAGFVVMALLIALVVAILLVLGIRDWRCYGLAFLWPPVLSAIQTGNVTIPLALGAALAWRYRDGARAAVVSLGVALAAKFFVWPLLLWLGATRRYATAAVSVVVGLVIVVASWAVIGFAGLREYPDLLRRLQELEESEGYTVYALALDLGASAGAARALGIALAAASLVGVVVFARRGDERRAFVLAIGATLACSPIVWLHYFALLLVAVAVAESSLGPAWFVPLAMYASTGTHNGTTLQTAATIGAAVLTFAVAMRPTRLGGGRRFVSPISSPAGGRP
jgi:hypothetical protein